MTRSIDFKGIGIDPGLVNLGWAVVTHANDMSPFKVWAFNIGTDNPSSNKDIIQYVKNRVEWLSQSFFYENALLTATIERFVPYAGTHSDIMEEVNQIIGMFKMSLKDIGLDTQLYRAIEWKTALVKLLNKHTGFENPSKTGALDKVFSIAAAKHIIDPNSPRTEFNDHEADAICLAAFPFLKRSAELADAAAKAARAKNTIRS